MTILDAEKLIVTFSTALYQGTRIKSISDSDQKMIEQSIARLKVLITLATLPVNDEVSSSIEQKKDVLPKVMEIDLVALVGSISQD